MDWTFPLWKEIEFCVCLSCWLTLGCIDPLGLCFISHELRHQPWKSTSVQQLYCILSFSFLTLCRGGCGQRHYAFGMFACLSRRMYVRSTLTESLQMWDIHSLYLKNELLMVVRGQRSRLLWSYIYSLTELLCRNIYIWSSIEDYNTAARQMVGLKTGPECILNEWGGRSAGRGKWWGNSGEEN